MKGRPIHHRFRFAWQGICAAVLHEASFRTHLLAAVLAIGLTLWIGPPLIWLALVVISIALVLAAELFNTALEHALDGLHPQHAAFVELAKDCAAGAVLVMSISAVVVFVLMVMAVQ